MIVRRHAAVAAAGLVVALAGLVLWVGSGHGAEDEATFLARMRAEGWVEIGQFGGGWPARLRDTQSGYESIAFVRADGSRHRYHRFHGYRLRVVFLDADDGSEIIVVLRAARKGRDDELLPER